MLVYLLMLAVSCYYRCFVIFLLVFGPGLLYTDLPVLHFVFLCRLFCFVLLSLFFVLLHYYLLMTALLVLFDCCFLHPRIFYFDRLLLFLQFLMLHI